MEAAIAEGVYLLGAERNPNVVKMSAYAPSFANLNFEEWSPDLVSFQADWDLTVLSASYYMEQLFSTYRGIETVPTTTVAGDYNPLWWVATAEDGDSAMYFKVINSGNSSIPLTLDLDKPWSGVNGTRIVSFVAQRLCSLLIHIEQTSPKLSDFNFVGNATAVSPTTITDLPGAGSGKWTWAVPAWSINVLQFTIT